VPQTAWFCLRDTGPQFTARPALFEFLDEHSQVDGLLEPQVELDIPNVVLVGGDGKILAIDEGLRGEKLAEALARVFGQLK
jgi:hypothetical protein